MKIKIIFFMIISILLIGVVFSDGEETTTTPSELTEVGNVEQPIGNLIGEGISNTDVVVKGVKFIKKENGNTLINFLEGGTVIIKGNKFENVKESSPIELGNNGEITFANLTASKETVFTFDEINYKVPAGTSILYENGKVTFDKKAGESIEFKEESSDIFTKITSLGGKIFLEKDSEGNRIFTGNLKIGNDEVKGLNEKIGKVTISKTTGKISKVWENTDATIDGINHKVSDNLNIYYDENFVASSHTNENYFDYGKNSISLGGNGFTSNLGKTNSVFGNMNTAKFVKGIGTKTRNLEITMNGGNLEISKDTNIQSDLTFNVNGNGEYTIGNGRVSISSEENKIFAKSNEDKEGLLYSYDLNLNNGEYKLESNFFRDKNGEVLINANKPWETVIYNAKKINLKDARALELELEKEGRLIFVDEPYFLQWLTNNTLNPCAEAMMKELFLGMETANQNKAGVKGSPLEFYGLLKSEGAGFTNKGKATPFFETYCKNPKQEIIGTLVGLTLVGSNQNIQRLKDGDYIPEDLQVKDFPSWTRLTEGRQHPPILSAKDTFTYTAAVMNNQEEKAQKIFKEYHGEKRFEEMTSDELSYLNVVSYWDPFNSKHFIENWDKYYVKVWEGTTPPKDPKNIDYLRHLARLRVDFEYYLEKLGLFNYV